LVRDCESADIPEEYCVCQEERSVQPTDVNVTRAALEIVTHLNGLLANHSKICAHLALASVNNAQLIRPSRVVLSANGKAANSTTHFLSYR
jgi:Protein of unknown function (DUF229)